MLAECLAEHGYDVTQFISNFEHRSKTFRARSFQTIRVEDDYTVRIIPSCEYSSHISVRRLRYERSFARNLLKSISQDQKPDFVILAEPALFYYDILLKRLILNGVSILVLDVIDLWPELFELAIPKKMRWLSTALLAPFYYWRQRLYRYPKAIVAVAHDYLNVARKLASSSCAIFDVVYWAYPDDERDSAVPQDNPVRQLVQRKRESDRWLVYAGTLGENYDIHAIIDTATRFANSRDAEALRVKFIVAGDGPLKELCASKTSENFVFLGRLKSSELKLLYAHCDVALCTYKGESTVAMPIKFFDYVRYGLPMVNSLGRDIHGLIQEHGLGLNYDPYSADSLWQAVKTLISDNELRNKCSTNAMMLAPQFRADVQYSKVVNVLQRLGCGLSGTR